MKLELELDEVKHIVAVLLKSDPLSVYGTKPLAEKIQKQAENQKPDEG